MATPVVSGSIALLLSKYPDMTNVEVKMRLKETAADLGFAKRKQGWGQDRRCKHDALTPGKETPAHRHTVENKDAGLSAAP